MNPLVSLTGRAGLFSLELAIRHDLGVAIGAHFAAVSRARQRLELLAWPVMLPVVTELESIRHSQRQKR